MKPDGHRSPSVRCVFKPLLNLFHGAPGSKRWKNAVDALLKAVRQARRGGGRKGGGAFDNKQQEWDCHWLACIVALCNGHTKPLH